jgi:hypothetical protein
VPIEQKDRTSQWRLPHACKDSGSGSVDSLGDHQQIARKYCFVEALPAAIDPGLNSGENRAARGYRRFDAHIRGVEAGSHRNNTKSIANREQKYGESHQKPCSD